MEKNLDFDKIENRRNTKSLKYDFAKKKGMPEDVLPLWVADMDFQTSSYIKEALNHYIQKGIFGYSEVQTSYFEIVRDWMKRHHEWNIEEKWLVKTPGVVFALAMAVRAFTNPGDHVMIQSPVYYPFSEVIKNNGRQVVSSDLVLKEDHRYHIDFKDFEKKLIENDVKLFLLCNPHNPVARVWTKQELEMIRDLCLKHSVMVVSDEIHADFVFKGKHQVFANIKEAYKNITVTCTSPSKTFNLAGLQISNIIIADPKMRRAFRKEIQAAGAGLLNTCGLIACEAAYTKGEVWYEEMKKYVEANIQYTKEYVQKNLPGVTMIDHEGTYLVWLDFRKTGFSHEELEKKIIYEARLWLDSGAIFGNCGRGFQRINVACPRATLKEALKRIQTIL